MNITIQNWDFLNGEILIKDLIFEASVLNDPNYIMLRADQTDGKSLSTIFIDPFVHKGDDGPFIEIDIWKFKSWKFPNQSCKHLQAKIKEINQIGGLLPFIRKNY